MEILSSFVNGLVHNGLVYPNPTWKWASAPLLVHNPAPLPNANLEHKMTKLGNEIFYHFRPVAFDY